MWPPSTWCRRTAPPPQTTSTTSTLRTTMGERSLFPRYFPLPPTPPKVLKKERLHRPGIEPGPPAWQASILPLNQRCFGIQRRSFPRNVWRDVCNRKQDSPGILCPLSSPELQSIHSAKTGEEVIFFFLPLSLHTTCHSLPNHEQKKRFVIVCSVCLLWDLEGEQTHPQSHNSRLSSQLLLFPFSTV